MSNLEQKNFDVIVVGAGPAGAMAAIETIKAGFKTVIIEKVALPRRKVCAGGLVKRAVNLISDDIDFPIEQQCHAITMQTKGTGSNYLEQRENLVTMVCRSSFDKALIDHATHLGAQVFDETKVIKITPHAENITLQSKEKAFTCQYLIFAEGAAATLSNQFWQDSRLLLPSLEADIYPNAETLAAYQEAIFDFGQIQGGYAWVFPKGNHLSVGLAVMNKTCKVSLQHAFDQYLNTLGLDNANIRNRKGFVIPLTPRNEPMAKQRMLLVGDTAGFADPITAEGLTHAIQSGIGAGKAISSAFDSPDKVAEIYQRETVRPILDELRIARLLAKVIYHPNPMLRDLLFKYYGNRLCRGMADLIEGKRTYASSLKKHKFLNSIIKKASA